MRIMFAAPDRDLLECYKKLLEDDLGETVTAFDGTQVLSLLSAERFDVAVLDDALPRIGFEKLAKRIDEEKIPLVVLTDGGTASYRRTAGSGGAYLTYPFTPETMENVIKDALEKAAEEDE